MAASTGTASTVAPSFRNTTPPCAGSRSQRPTANRAAKGIGRRTRGGGRAAEVSGSVASWSAGRQPHHPALPVSAGTPLGSSRRPDRARGTRARAHRGGREGARRSIPAEGLDDQPAELQARQRTEHRRARLPGRGDKLVHGTSPLGERGGHLALGRRQRGQHDGAAPPAGSATGPPRPTPRRPAAGSPGSRPRSSISSPMPATTRASGPASRRKARQPATAGSSRRPGTICRPRPCSSAQAAVVRAPLRAPASTTTVASARPLMIRFRRGNVPRLGAVSGGNSLITAPPCATIARASPRWAAGYRRRWPPPITATVVPPARTRRVVGGRVDPEREARHHGRPEQRDRVRDAGARLATHGRRPARTHDRDRVPPVQGGRIACDVQHRWRQLDPAQAPGIVPVGQRDRADARTIDRRERRQRIGGHLDHGVGDGPRERRRSVAQPCGGRDQGRGATRAPCGLEHAACLAEGRDQPGERHRPHPDHAVEHHPGVAFLAGQRPGSGDGGGRAERVTLGRHARPDADGLGLGESPRPGTAHAEHQPAARSVRRSTGARKRAASSR